MRTTDARGVPAARDADRRVGPRSALPRRVTRCVTVALVAGRAALCLGDARLRPIETPPELREMDGGGWSAHGALDGTL
ncbi:MAG: hypothetical protein AB7S26_31510 [Sandaracinaceae bacterium]